MTPGLWHPISEKEFFLENSLSGSFGNEVVDPTPEASWETLRHRQTICSP